jgi:hypothetical protein
MHRGQTEMFVPSKGQVSNIIIEGEGMQVDSYHIGDLMKLGKTLMKIDVLTSMLWSCTCLVTYFVQGCILYN